MSQITVSISDDLRSKLDKYVKDNGYATTSAFVAEAIADRLSNPNYWQRVTMALILENRREIGALRSGKSPDELEEWSKKETYDAVINGYKPLYGHVFEYIAQDELSQEQVTHVYDILDVYRDLQASAKKLGDKDLEETVKFPGFDGNNEPELLGFFRYLKENGRWDFIESREKDDNSHSSVPRITYPGMIERHREITRSFRDDNGMLKWRSLTKDEINHILSDK